MRGPATCSVGVMRLKHLQACRLCVLLMRIIVHSNASRLHTNELSHFLFGDTASADHYGARFPAPRQVTTR